MPEKTELETKKLEIFDLQVLIGTLQSQLQAKFNELNQLIIKEKSKNDRGTVKVLSPNATEK